MTSNNNNRRICAGIYRRYDGSEVQVLLVTKDVDTGEEIIVCKRRFHDRPEDYFTMTKASFCDTVDTPDGTKPKYTRQTQHRESEGTLLDNQRLGFNVTARIKYRNRKDPDDEYPIVRTLHTAYSYREYAEELCKYHLIDTRRVRLCMESKRLNGVTKDEYNILLEDVRFTNNCFKTVLREYAELFYGRYGSKQLSIRKYAEEHGMNRGSVVYAQEKMLKAFTRELEGRDKSDGIVRIRVQPKDGD